MKKINVFMCMLLLLTIIVGCSSDNEDFSQQLLGEWEMELGNTSEVLPGESLFKFQNDGVLSVSSKSKVVNDAYLLPSGTYHYSVAKNEIMFSGNSIPFRYVIIGDKLQLSFSPELYQDNMYPLILQYVFHKRK